MNEDAFNMSVRKFLEESRRDRAARDRAGGARRGSQRQAESGALPAKATFTIGGVNLTFDVTGEVETG